MQYDVLLVSVPDGSSEPFTDSRFSQCIPALSILRLGTSLLGSISAWSPEAIYFYWLHLKKCSCQFSCIKYRKCHCWSRYNHRFQFSTCSVAEWACSNLFAQLSAEPYSLYLRHGHKTTQPLSKAKPLRTTALSNSGRYMP
jgi:hypothetical protein